MNKDLLFNLIQTFDESELLKAKKYLAIYDSKGYSNIPLKIYNSYLIIERYNESILFKKSKCISLSHFRKEKSILKYRLLDFIRSFSIQLNDNPLFRWRKEIDYGFILKSKGELFWSESISILKQTIQDCNNEASNTYVYAAYEESSEMFHKIPPKNFQDVLLINSIQAQTSAYLEEENRIFDYYKKIIFKHVSSSFIKTKEDAILIEDLLRNEYYAKSIDDIHGKACQYILLLSNCFLGMILHIDKEKLKLTSNEFAHLFNSFEPKSWYNTSFFKIGFYIGFGNCLLYTQQVDKLEKHLITFRLYLESTFSNPKDYPLYWSRYFHFLYSLINLKKEAEETALLALQNHILYFEKRIPYKILINFKIELIRMHFDLKNYEAIADIANEIRNVDENSSHVDDQKNICKLILIASLFSISQKRKTILNDIVDIESVAAMHYRYFRSLDKNYYQFELKFCSFFKSISIKNSKNLKTELIKLKKKIIELDSKDPYHFVTKISNHSFDFYKWIDECILAV